MANFHTTSARKALTTPRAAAVAGILFALFYGSGVALIRLAIPAGTTTDGGARLQFHAKSIELALNLVPFAGIAFLWFIGVIRDRLGDLEDRFFATVFLGSGLLFLALTFTGAALAGGLLSSYMIAPHENGRSPASAAASRGADSRGKQRWQVNRGRPATRSAAG